EVQHCFAQAQVACGPGIRTGEVPGEEPVCRPLADSGQRGEPGLDLPVWKRSQALEVEVGAGEVADVLCLAPREPQRQKFLRPRESHPFAPGEGVRVLEALAEGLDDAISHR